MRRAFIENIAFGFLMILPFLVIDYIWVRQGQQENSIWSNLQSVLVFAVPVGFFLINKRYNARLPEPLKLIGPFLLAIALSVIWAFVGLTIYMNFHMGIGGGI